MSCIGMTTSKTSFFYLFVIVAIAVLFYMVVDHIINYETWENHHNYFLKDFYGYEVTCDVNYFAEPSMCRVVDDQGTQVPNETVRSLIGEKCYFIDSETGNALPCRM